eukprot:scaffold1002_cov117-Isochrysis_galbana.AAC.5
MLDKHGQCIVADCVVMPWQRAVKACIPFKFAAPSTPPTHTANSKGGRRGGHGGSAVQRTYNRPHIDMCGRQTLGSRPSHSPARHKHRGIDTQSNLLRL